MIFTALPQKQHVPKNLLCRITPAKNCIQCMDSTGCIICKHDELVKLNLPGIGHASFLVILVSFFLNFSINFSAMNEDNHLNNYVRYWTLPQTTRGDILLKTDFKYILNVFWPNLEDTNKLFSHVVL